jgi:hypothetical protein
VKAEGLQNGNSTTEVYNIIGEKIYESHNLISDTSLNQTIDLNTASEGIYIVKVISEKNVYTQKILISK